MKFLLALSVVIAVSVALSSAACYNGHLKFDRETKTKGCEHLGKMHEVNTEWTAECLECTCTKSGMECCEKSLSPVMYDEEACIAEFDKETCTYKVTKKDDPSEPCAVEAWVG